MAVADCPGLPVAVHTAAATPHEVTLVPDTLAATSTSKHPDRLIGDKAYDSDPLLDLASAAVGIELIAPREPQTPQNTGRPPAPPVQTPLAGGTAVRLAATLPARVGAP
jgi:hypothetical protein